MSKQKTITEKELCRAIATTWEIAHETGNCPAGERWWGSVLRELDGMQSLLIMARASGELQGQCFLLWQVALERQSMAGEKS